MQQHDEVGASIYVYSCTNNLIIEMSRRVRIHIVFTHLFAAFRL